MTLTQTAIFTKRAGIFTAVFLTLALIGWNGYQYWYKNIYLPAQPVVEEQPTVEYGKLQKLNIPANNVSPTNYAYSLATQTGNLPTDFPKLIKVYAVPQPTITLLDPDRAKVIAKSFDFTNPPEILTQTQYKFEDDQGGEMRMEINTQNFKYHRQIATDSAIFQNSLPYEDDIKRGFKEYLVQKNLSKSQLENGRMFVTYENKGPKDSKTAIVSIWPQDITEGKKKYPIITANPKIGLINAQVTPAGFDKDRYPVLNYVFWPIDTQAFSTYPIKPVNEAFEELKAGKGTIMLEPASKDIAITNVKMGYFMTEEFPQYLQPVYIFEAEDFQAVVPAVTNEFISQSIDN